MTDAPHVFTLDQLYEEVITIGIEKRDFLNKKLEKGKISAEFANLENFRLERLKALAQYLKEQLRVANVQIVLADNPTDATDGLVQVQQSIDAAHAAVAAAMPNADKKVVDDFDD